MRILHIGKYFPPVPGGMERFLADLAGAQRKAGNDVAILVHGDRRPLTGADPEWIRRCPVWLRLLFAPISPAFPFWLRRSIKQHKPELLHIHMPNPSAFWALALPSASCLPWVIHWHSDVETNQAPWPMRLAYSVYRIFERALLEHASAIIVTSPPYLAASRVLQPWRAKCHVIPLGLDAARLPEKAGDDAGLWRTGGLRLLSIGRLTYYKGFETLIRAVADLSDAELIIVGEGEERANLEKVLSGRGGPTGIRLIGTADDVTCAKLLASCDIFCLPSIERTEAFGVVLMEAMRYGKPLLASRIEGSGVPWVVRHGWNGELVPPQDVPAWRNAITRLAADSDYRIRLGQNGRTRLDTMFGIKEVAHDLDRIYRRVLDLGVPCHKDGMGDEARPLVVIPALNEAADIGQIVAKARALGYPVLVVDDGSTDDTVAIARRNGAQMLCPPLRQGAWGAMQTGIRYALKHGYDGVVTMDADGQHEPKYIARLIEEGRMADVVVGACPGRGSRLRRVAWAYFKMLTGFRLEDLTSGFRYYNTHACRILAQEEATLLDYQDVGVLLLLHRAGMEISEVKVAMSQRLHGASRIFSSWWIVGRYMVETTLLCLARWKTKPVRS